MLPESEFPKALESNNIGRPALRDSAWPAKILSRGERTKTRIFTSSTAWTGKITPACRLLRSSYKSGRRLDVDERLILALSVLLIVGGYQCFWILQAVSEQKKWTAMADTGAVYSGTIACIENDYARYGERLNIFVRLCVPDRGELLLHNWPAMRHCPYVAGSEVKVLWSPRYPGEFAFTGGEAWLLRGLNPVVNGRIQPGMFKFRFFLVWTVAAAVILLGIYILGAAG
jgi:hypothetical protein